MVLERRVQIGLRGMAGVPGLGKQAEIGQTETLRHCSRFPKVRRIAPALVRCMGERAEQQDGLDGEGYEKQRGFSHSVRYVSFEVPCSKLQEIFDPQSSNFILIAR
jgi:hypothetical protein